MQQRLPIKRAASVQYVNTWHMVTSGKVTVASHIVHQENSQRADVLSHKGLCLSKIRQNLHDSALKELHFSRQGHSPRGPNVGLSELLKGSDYPVCNLGVYSAVRGEKASQAVKL